MAPGDLIDIHTDNLYEILGVQHDATIKQITKSYRKKALKYHPDKNPDPAAHKMFLKLSQMMELLSNETARSNYDIVLKARAAAKLRTQQLDSKRRKLKESLECKEKQTGCSAAQRAENQLKETIKRLQAEGESLLRREEEKMRAEFSVKTSVVIADKATIKIKWKCKTGSGNAGYSESVLRDILTKYGPVSDIVVNSKRTGSALAVFDSIASAKICMQKEAGLEHCPLSFRMVHNTDNNISTNLPCTNHLPTIDASDNQGGSATFSSFPGSYSHTTVNCAGEVDKDYESLILMRLRQAEERKRLIEDIEADREENGLEDEL